MIITEERRQQLAGACKRSIEHLQRQVDNYSLPGGEDLRQMYQQELEIQQISLAALEAKHHPIEIHQGVREYLEAGIAECQKSSYGSTGKEMAECMAKLLQPVYQHQHVDVTAQNLEPLACEGNSSVVPNGSGLIPVPDEFLSAEQNEHGLFELSEDCMVRLAVALAQQSKGMVIPARWKLVPVDADQKMIDAAYRALDAGCSPGGAYADMIATAPPPPSD